MDEVCAIVLAAGKGTRLKGNTPKVLRLLADKPLVYWTLELLKKLGIWSIVVTGYKAEKVENYIRKSKYDVAFIRQSRLMGTGHAIKIALRKVPPKFQTILVLFGDDSCLYKTATLKRLLSRFLEKRRSGIFLVHKASEPTLLGGLKVDKNGNVVGVVDKEELISSKVKMHFQVCGAFVFDKKWLIRNIRLIKRSRLSGEYPLPSLIGIAAQKKEFLRTYCVSNENEWQSINTEEDLALAERKKRRLFKK
jgi:bifunctional N-acetylglucosamine-1-phosphate-uridyltransferase/glucosamine-1-phosphate-acetyltransferase GlmU-like protein